MIVLRAGEAGAPREIVLTQDDVRQLQLAKGAIASGIAMLQHVAGVPPEDVHELMLAGGFGNYLSIASAVRIGLIPGLPPDRIRYVGNAASLGAQLCLLSERERARADGDRAPYRARLAGRPSGFRADLRRRHELSPAMSATRQASPDDLADHRRRQRRPPSPIPSTRAG